MGEKAQDTSAPVLVVLCSQVAEAKNHLRHFLNLSFFICIMWVIVSETHEVGMNI